MKRQTQLLSALVLGAGVALGFPAVGQETPEQQDEQRQEQQREQQEQQREQQQQERDQPSRQGEAQRDQSQPDAPPRPGERSAQERPDDPQRARDDQRQQQQGDQQERERRAMLGVAFAEDVESQRGQQEGRQQQEDGRQQQEGQQQGLEIVAIMPGGAAEQANLRRGDSIISINGQEIRSADEVDRLVQQRSVGDRLDLVILRDGQQQQTQVTLQAAPERDLQQGSQRPDFDRGARSSRGWLGVTLDTRDQREAGAMIERVYPAGPAARAGLRQGDRILQVTGQQVSGYEDVLQVLSDTRPGETVELTVASNGQQQQVSVRLDDAGVFSDGEEEEFDSSTMWRDPSGRTAQIPEHDMMLEQHRRFAEQHERMERLLLEVQRDIQEIKQQMSGQSTRQPSGQAPQRPDRQSSQRSEEQPPRQPEGQSPRQPDDVQSPPEG
jgi:C-terminal processing protease CtpA/Prc